MVKSLLSDDNLSIDLIKIVFYYLLPKWGNRGLIPPELGVRGLGFIPLNTLVVVALDQTYAIFQKKLKKNLETRL